MDTTPRPLLLAALIVAVESVISIAYGLYLTVEAFVGTPREFGQAVAVGVALTLFAAPLPFVAWGMSKARFWSRTPAVLAQLLALWMAYFMMKGGAYAGAVPTIAVAFLGLVCIFLPGSTAALIRHWREE
jgi:hypothetical protein